MPLNVNLFNRLSHLLARIGTWLVHLAAGALMLLFIFVCLAAFMRYFVGRPLGFTEELVGLLFLTAVFLSLPFATSRKMHLSVTIALNRMKGGWRKLAIGFNLAVMFAFTAWFTVLSFEFASFAYEIGASSEQVRILLWPWMAILPIVSGLIGLVTAVQFVQLLLGGGEPVESQEADPS